jgi:hypothetical protein
MGPKTNCELNLENEAKTFSFMDFSIGKQVFDIEVFSMLIN